MVSNTVYQLVGKVVTMVITMVATFLITRFYGLDGYGSFNLMLSFPALFFIIADFGFNAIATRDLAVADEKAGRYLGNIIILRTAISFILIMIASVILAFLPYNVVIKAGIIIGLFTIFTSSLYSTANIGFQIKLRYDLSNIANALGSIITIGIVLAMVFTRQSILFAAVAYVLSGFFTILLSFYFLKRLGIRLDFTLDEKLCKNLLLTSLPLGLMFVFSQINFKADSVLLSFRPLPESFGYNNIQTVGIYGLPYKLFEVALVVPTFFMNSVYPVMVRRYSESKEKLLDTFKKSIVFLVVSGIACGIFGLLFSDLIIKLLGSGRFSDSVLVLKILLGTITIFYLTQPVSWLIVTLGGQKHLPYIYLVAAVANITLNFIFIPKYSFIASAHITWITELFILVMLIFTARKVWKRV